jgi:hypothetical protein
MLFPTFNNGRRVTATYKDMKTKDLETLWNDILCRPYYPNPHVLIFLQKTGGWGREVRAGIVPSMKKRASNFAGPFRMDSLFRYIFTTYTSVLQQ